MDNLNKVKTEKEEKVRTVTTTDWGNEDEEWGDDDDDWGLAESVDKMKIDEIKSEVVSVGSAFYINVIEDYTAEDMSHEVRFFMLTLGDRISAILCPLL